GGLQYVRRPFPQPDRANGKNAQQPILAPDPELFFSCSGAEATGRQASIRLDCVRHNRAPRDRSAAALDAFSHEFRPTQNQVSLLPFSFFASHELIDVSVL